MVEIVNFFEFFDLIITQYRVSQIINMDETATQFDMIENKTIVYVGATSIDATSSGYDKTGFTTCSTITGDGLMLTPYLVFAKLKKNPNQNKCPNENNLFINVCQSGFMNEHLQIDYINKVLEPYSEKDSKKLFLIWDQHESHKTALVKSHLASLGHEMLLFPARSTSYMQPLDVFINIPFKSKMKEQRSDWFDNADELTQNGNLKRASYGSVIRINYNYIK